MTGTGTVYLVGGGPGDPDLLTVRAAELLARADAVVYDPLVDPAVLDRCREGADLINVGARGAGRARTRAEVGELLLELARSYAVVVRLWGGDPFVLGGGGEEGRKLASGGVRFEVVPGIVQELAAPAFAGIPVTHPGAADAVTFVAASEDAGGDPDWESLARTNGTLVFSPGVAPLESGLQRLIEAGRRPETPAAVIEWGTRARQRTVTGDLATLPGLAEEAGVEGPSVVVVGEVVRLRERLRWFETRPLFGRRVVVTRARSQAGDLVRALQGLGAEVIQFPTIRITDPLDVDPLLRAASEADRFDWIVFTSVNGVTRFWAALREVGRDTRSLAGVSICAIGPATGAALELEGVCPDLIPEQYVAEGVVEALTGEFDLRGSRVLLPRAETARPVLPEALTAHGAEVVEVAAYRTVPDAGETDELRRRLLRGEVDLVTFTSSSTVRNYVEILGPDVGAARVASIGPITSATAREFGLLVDVEAEQHTIPGLVDAVGRWYAPGGG